MHAADAKWCYYVEIIPGRIATRMKLAKETQLKGSTKKGERERKRKGRKCEQKRKICKEIFSRKEKHGKIDKTRTLWNPSQAYIVKEKEMVLGY
jgi:hypothetical protein